MARPESEIDDPDVRHILKSGNADEVVYLLSSPNVAVRLTAIDVIKNRRLTEGANVLEHLAATDDETRTSALLALEQLALPRSRDTFVDALGDEAARPVGLRGLFLIGDAGAIAAAEDAYRTGNTVTKQVALFCLNRTATPNTIEALERLLDDERAWRWRRRIKKALRQAKSKGPRPLWP